MIFRNKDDLLLYIKGTKELGFGSQGITYYDPKTNKAIKIFHDFFDDDPINSDTRQLDDILRFGEFRNSTYIFPEDVLIIYNTIVGYISNYVKGNSLYKINPLSINIDIFTKAVATAIKDTKIVSEHNIQTYDVLYNIMYGNKEIHVIDTDCYYWSTLPKDQLIKNNNYNFNMEIKYFLIDSYFDEFIKDHKYLNELYCANDSNILDLLKEFKKTISEYIGCEMISMKQGKSCLNKNKHKAKYIRLF